MMKKRKRATRKNRKEGRKEGKKEGRIGMDKKKLKISEPFQKRKISMMNIWLPSYFRGLADIWGQ